MPKLDPQNITVVITGASKGIGFAIASHLEAKGYQVIGTSRNPARAKMENPEIQFPLLELNLSDNESILRFVEEIIETYGKINVLVNNAGNAVVGPLESMSADDLKKQFEVNFFGAHQLVGGFLPILKKQSPARIINIGSFGGRVALPFQVPYSASKAALAIYSDGLGMELKNSGIRVSLIEPGDVKTKFHEGRIFTQGYYKDPRAQRAVEIMKKDEERGFDPIKIAKRVEKIIEAKNPKPRYIVDWKVSFLGLLLRLLPTKWSNKIVAKTYGL